MSSGAPHRSDAPAAGPPVVRVLFLTQYGQQAASSRTRVFQYLPSLSAQGIEHRVLTVLPDRGISGSQILVTRQALRKLGYYAWATWRTLTGGLHAWWLARRYNVLFVQKVVLPAPVRWLLRLRRPALVFDFDDAIFTTEVQRRNWLAGWKQRRNARGVPAMLALADRAVVENDYTGSFATRYCPITTITGPIDTRGHHPAAEPPPAGRMVLGWIGSATTLPYLDLIREPLQRLSRRWPHLQVHVVGAPQARLDGVPLVASPWRLDREVADLQGFDIGLMPVPDDPWTRGKGGYKLLQYMAVGLPVVTHPVGVNEQIVRHGENGFLAREAAEWEECLGRLIADAGLRRRMGQRGREIVVAEYSLERASRVLAEALRQTVAGRSA